MQKLEVEAMYVELRTTQLIYTYLVLTKGARVSTSCIPEVH